MWGVYVSGFYFPWDADPGIVDMVTVLCTELSFVLKKNTLSINVSFLCTDCGVFASVFPSREGQRYEHKSNPESCCSEKEDWLLD